MYKRVRDLCVCARAGKTTVDCEALSEEPTAELHIKY
jgi:hypothetical protein